MRRVIINGSVLASGLLQRQGSSSAAGTSPTTRSTAARHQRRPAAVLHPQQQPRTAGPTACGTRYSSVTTARPRQPSATGQPNQYTTLPTTPVSQEEPFLYTDRRGSYSVFVPAVQHDSVGPVLDGRHRGGPSIPIRQFFIANPAPRWRDQRRARPRAEPDPDARRLRPATQPIVVSRPTRSCWASASPTLIPQHGNVAMQTASVPGIKLSGMIFDAGPRNSPALLQVGGAQLRPATQRPRTTRRWCRTCSSGSAAPTPGRRRPAWSSTPTTRSSTTSGRGGPTTAPASAGPATRADTGVIVNGDDVTAYGLFVEHFQKFEVIWNGQNGEDIFFQNEMPYDPPSQAAWMSSPTTDGYPAFLVTPRRANFQGYGMGSYWFFNQGVPILATQAFQSPTPPASSSTTSSRSSSTPSRQRRDRLGDQRRRRIVDRGQRGRPGRRRQLPVIHRACSSR